LQKYRFFILAKMADQEIYDLGVPPTAKEIKEQMKN
jgi:hypothetical protein